LLNRTVEGKSELADLRDAAKRPTSSVKSRLDLGGAYSKRGYYGEALAEYTAALDSIDLSRNGSNLSQFKGVLFRMAALGSVHDPALAMLRERRDRLENQIGSRVSPYVWQKAFAYNEVLKEPRRNAELYNKLTSESLLRQQLFSAVFTQLVEGRNYLDAANIVDLEEYVNAVYPKFVDVGSSGGTMTDAVRNQEGVRRRVMDVTVEAVEALLATDQLYKAQRLAGRVLDTYPGEDVRRRLSRAATRANDAKVSGVFTHWLLSYAETVPTSAK
jgi:tetratricopeptide (TPR) repeat protein